MINCSACGNHLETDVAVIIWNDKVIDGVSTVTELAVTHRYRECDQRSFLCSAGCAYGKHWHPFENGGRHFAKKAFARPEDKALLAAVVAQRWIEYQGAQEECVL